MTTKWSRVHDPHTSTDRLASIILTQGVWMLAAVLTLFFFGLYTVENYFIVSFIGLLIVLQVYAPTGEPPAWWSLVRLVTLAGYIIFGWIMYERINEVAVLV
ncbi:hypothetical protein [Halobacteriaceae bacterium SHR40]|uniref:hypothetical protein n=1 Tax=Halovenus amylolytica TaxID=2500550 RepID=UPI000FE332E8